MEKIQLALYPCDPLLISNWSITVNNVGKHCLDELIVKLKVKLRFKTFY